MVGTGEELVVGGDGWQRAGVGWQAGDDGGWVQESAHRQRDDPLGPSGSLLTVEDVVSGVTVRAGSTRGNVAAGLDGDDVGGDRADGQRGPDAGDHVLGGMAAVQQQDVDQLAGAVGVAVDPA